MACYDANAQSKKKGKEPELAISKRGNLIFEDDFSGKELEWVQTDGEWRIFRDALVPKLAKEGVKYAGTEHPFDKTANIVIQLRALLAPGSGVSIGASAKTSALSPHVMVRTNTHVMAFIYLDETGATQDIAPKVFTYPKARWMTLILERLARDYAFTLDGKTIRYQVEDGDIPPYDRLRITLYNFAIGPCAIDDVKVWEALPKDEGPEKDKKKK
ncbi:MAG: hypothetical protein AB1696_16430 [Planctomycetota bacterium]